MLAMADGIRVTLELILTAGALMAAGLSSTAGAPQSDPARDLLAPTGTLRVGINFGNALLTHRDASGQPGGIAVDLAMELGLRLGVPVELIDYTSAGRMADDAASGAWDVAFLAADPGRADRIRFTQPYLEIDSTYLVRAESPIRTIEDVDQEGVRIVVSENSAYDLFLRRDLEHAELVRAPGVEPSNALFLAGEFEALAGLRPVLVGVAEGLDGARILEGRFTTVEQAIGTPRNRGGAGAYLEAFVEEAKASGLVADLIERNGIRGVSVAP